VQSLCATLSDLLEVIENAKQNSNPMLSSLPSDLAEMMKNPMDSSGVDQLLARVVSSASTVNKGLSSPPAIRSYTPSATIEEITGTSLLCILLQMNLL